MVRAVRTGVCSFGHRGRGGTTKYAYYAGSLPWTADGPWASDTVTNCHNTARMRSGLGLEQPGGTYWTNGFTYDAAHRLATVISPAGTFAYTYTYDNIGQLKSALSTLGLVPPDAGAASAS